jgi:hypothetical protein
MRTAAAYFSFVLLLFTLASCSDDNQRSYVQYYHPQPGLIFASSSTAGAARNPAHGKPGHRCDIPEGSPLPVSASLPAGTNAFPATTPSPGVLTTPTTSPGLENGAAINPAHGKPGHRCDIPVGAPLNTAAVNAINKQVGPTLINTTQNANQLNPAHGQPGHRCDIAAGAPLNSAPQKTVSSTNAKSLIPVSSPANGNLALNPSHGQPGHRCDIAVGAPLNSSRSKTPSTTPVTAPSLVATKTLSREDSLTILNALPTDSTGARLNPAHGQPGHDCSVAVGKPLKQKE